MAKRKKRRRKKPEDISLILETWRAAVAERTRLLIEKATLPGESTDIDLLAIADAVRNGDWDALLRKLNLTPDTFFYTKWGDAVIEETVQALRLNAVSAGTLNENPDASLFELVQNFTRKANDNLKNTNTAKAVANIGMFWEVALALASDATPREKPYAGEHPFHFMSTATFRVQVAYRVLTEMYPGPENAAARYTVCRLLPSLPNAPATNVEDERINTVLTTELWANGNNEFTVSARLREMFLKTDVGNLKASTVRFPYNAFSVQTPDDFIMFSIIGYPEEDLRVWVVYNHARGSVQIPEKLADDLTLGEIWDILPEDFWGDNKDREQSCREAFQIICNLCLYLESQNAEVNVREGRGGTAPNPRNRRALRLYAKRQLTPISHVLYPSLEKAASVGGETSKAGTRQHWVRGHWRMQPYWPEGRDHSPVTKRIWIEPHLRGSLPEDVDDVASPRRYKV